MVESKHVNSGPYFWCLYISIITLLKSLFPFFSLLSSTMILLNIWRIRGQKLPHNKHLSCFSSDLYINAYLLLNFLHNLHFLHSKMFQLVITPYNVNIPKLVPYLKMLLLTIYQLDKLDPELMLVKKKIWRIWWWHLKRSMAKGFF